MKKIVFCLFGQFMFFNMVNAACLHSKRITISSCSATDASGNSTNFTCNNEEIEGLAVCSETNLITEGNAAETVTTSGISVTQNDYATYCWCKIIYPINTYWVQITSNNSFPYESPSACQKGCVIKCAAQRSYIQHIINNTLDTLTMPDMK